jgi:hypothetical protein
VPFVCVPPMVTSWARRTEDLTCGKTGEKDAVLIARLTAQLRGYLPGPVDERWGRLRHLGTRRGQLITEAGGQIQQMRDLLECAWPAALDTARRPFRPGHVDRGVAGDRGPGRRRPRPHPAAGSRRGSGRWCGARSPAAAGRSPACGSSAGCSPRQHLTSREQNKLSPTQAPTVIAAAILRHLHAVITTGQARDPVTATHDTRHNRRALAAWPPQRRCKLAAGASPPRQ